MAALIRDLNTGNRRFAHLWATGEVAAHREDHKMIGHSSVGPVTVDCDVVADGDSELMAAVPGSEDETKLRAHRHRRPTGHDAQLIRYHAGWSRSQRLPYRSSKTATEP
ncbi:hypothetical protein ACIOEW_30875 [Streptomyces sp. NPDC087901]|uniref:MmyB family transcriptional regulator n=1 Tax=Streptomyces sp. NPDC087901 TaxID=3365818 RepID=UPI0037FE04A8